MTSVKDIDVDEPAGEATLGVGRFTFTDAYSVFDWGQMPDTIPGKGQSLCTMGAFNFERLEAEGIATHYRGVLPGDQVDPVGLVDCDDPPRVMSFDLANVPELPPTDDGYDYDSFHGAAGSTYVVPLEVIFRNRVPIGSSLRRRREPTEVGLDIDTWPDEPVELDEPIIEFSTKFERSDRYLDRDEADEIAGLAELDVIDTLARSVNSVITDRAEETGFNHDDGKIEVVYHAGDLLVADVVGTFDENRFTFNNQQVSKEVVRQFYRRFDPDWVEAVESAKTAAKAAGEVDWKGRCTADPNPLPSDVVEIVADLYASGAEQYTALGLFEVDELTTVIERLATRLEMR